MGNREHSPAPVIINGDLRLPKDQLGRKQSTERPPYLAQQTSDVGMTRSRIPIPNTHRTTRPRMGALESVFIYGNPSLGNAPVFYLWVFRGETGVGKLTE